MQQPDLQSFAFFDVDETLLNFKSMFSFRAFLFREEDAAENKAATFFAALHEMAAQCDRSEVNRWFYRSLAGYTPSDITAAVDRWFDMLQSEVSPVYISKTVDFLETVRANGVEPVFVSGSSDFILAPFANALNVRHLLCAHLVVENGHYTGELAHQPVIGEGKRLAIQSFAAKHNISLHAAYAVGDHISDLPMLETVGHPTVVTGHPELEAIAQARQWPML